MKRNFATGFDAPSGEALIYLESYSLTDTGSNRIAKINYETQSYIDKGLFTYNKQSKRVELSDPFAENPKARPYIIQSGNGAEATDSWLQLPYKFKKFYGKGRFTQNIFALGVIEHEFQHTRFGDNPTRTKIDPFEDRNNDKRIDEFVGRKPTDFTGDPRDIGKKGKIFSGELFAVNSENTFRTAYGITPRWAYYWPTTNELLGYSSAYYTEYNGPR